MMGEEKTNQTKQTKRLLLRIGIKLVGYSIFLFLIFHFVIGLYQIHDNDMYPSYMDGDLVITNKLGDYHVGDTVVYQGGDGVTHYGRIVAVGGDTVNLLGDGYYEINGNVPYEKIFYPTNKTSEMVNYPYQVPPDTYFVLGDMRQVAKDSRLFGATHKKNMRGKIVLLLFRGRGL